MKHTRIKNAASLLLALLLSLQLAAPACASSPGEDTEPAVISIHNTGGIDETGIQDELRLLPAPILQAFSRQGWSLHLDRGCLEELSARYGYPCVAATVYKLRRICLLGSGSTLHEFGHFLDWSLDFPEEIDQLYEAEAQGAAFLRSYAKSNRWEYFADYFALWIRWRKDEARMEELRIQTPMTHAWFMALEADGWSLDKMGVPARCEK